MLALLIVDDANGDDNDNEDIYQKDCARAWAMKTTGTFVSSWEEKQVIRQCGVGHDRRTPWVTTANSC